MVTPGSMSASEMARFRARGPGEPGPGRKGSLSVATARSYMATLSRELQVPLEELAGVSRGLAVTRRIKREPKTQASPLDAAAVSTILDDLTARRHREPELLAAAALAWTGALRMGDLGSVRARDVVVEEQAQRVRIVWWETKEAQLRG
eukprot:Rhum_TRINITY_DN15155_c1_g11::Rhum_TRINITY_DN15155_c1_g11_i1::g.140805::m.140805